MTSGPLTIFFRFSPVSGPIFCLETADGGPWTLVAGFEPATEVAWM